MIRVLSIRSARVFPLPFIKQSTLAPYCKNLCVVPVHTYYRASLFQAVFLKILSVMDVVISIKQLIEPSGDRKLGYRIGSFKFYLSWLIVLFVRMAHRDIPRSIV